MWSDTIRLRAPGYGLRTGRFARAGLPVALGLASVVWLVAIFAAPYVARRAAPGSAAAVLAVGTYLVGSVICHQQARRSFHLDGVQLPVCARCTGIYLAAPFGACFAWLFRRRRSELAQWRGPLILAALPTAVTVVLEWVSGTMIPGPIRFAAGVPIGFVVMWYLGVCLGRPESGVQRPESGVGRPVLG